MTSSSPLTPWSPLVADGVICDVGWGEMHEEAWLSASFGLFDIRGVAIFALSATDDNL